MIGAQIAGLGHYVPRRCVPNAEIEARLGLSAGWIERRTGIRTRHYVAADEALTDIAATAGGKALEQSGLSPGSISLLLLATSTPDHLLPPSAPLLAHRLGLGNAGGIDMAGACGGFLYALALADGYVRTHREPVLVVAANVLSRRIDEADRGSSALFADAAGAVVIAPSPAPAPASPGILGVKLVAEGALYGLIQIPGGGSRTPFAALRDPRQTLMVIADGQAVYSAAVDMMVSAATTALEKAGLTARDVTYFVPHQANARMMAAVARKLAIPPDRMLSTITHYANSSAATIPLTLSAAAPAAGYRPGDIVLMTAAGAGMTGGAAVWRW